jgi:hypothetical protein
MISEHCFRIPSLRWSIADVPALAADVPFLEMHADYSLSYVRRGTFGYRSRGTRSTCCGVDSLAIPVMSTCARTTMRVAEAATQGQCLSFHLSSELVESVGDRADVAASSCVPAIPEPAGGR